MIKKETKIGSKRSGVRWIEEDARSELLLLFRVRVHDEMGRGMEER